MTKKVLAIAAAATFTVSGASFVGRASAQVTAPPIVAKAITKQEAMKKYPPPDAKGYPVAMAAGRTEQGSSPGFFTSPYTGRVYDCREIKHGELVLDQTAKKVFVRP